MIALVQAAPNYKELSETAGLAPEKPAREPRQRRGSGLLGAVFRLSCAEDLRADDRFRFHGLPGPPRGV